MAINAKSNNAIKTLALTNDISNPNLLINPDFKINQRGQSTYSISPGSGYTVDRWKMWNGTLTVNSDKTITYKNVSGQASVLNQPLENPCNEECMLSIYVTNLTGVGYIYGSDSSDKVTGIISLTEGLNFIKLSSCASVNIKLVTDICEQCSITIKYVKLEKGSNVTQFIEPNPTEELNKCVSYYCKYNTIQSFQGINGQSYIFTQSFVTAMRTRPTCSISTANLYGTSASNISLLWNNNINYQYLIKAEINANLTAGINIIADAEIY